MKVKYKDWNPYAKTRATIEQAERILSEYEEDGLDLTIRQLHYQFVARDLGPNTQRAYDRLGRIMRDARLAGQISWSTIVDRTRSQKRNYHSSSPEHELRNMADTYAVDTRATQPIYIEVWVEKDALLGVVDRVCRKLDLGRFSTRGYPSVTALRDAAQRIERNTMARDSVSRRAVTLHLADHDPSGVDMTRSINDDLNGTFGVDVEVRRIGLTMGQVRQLNPPPNFAKEKDPRRKEYVEQFGEECWELDALDPPYLAGLIEREVDALTDHELREAEFERETEDRARLVEFAAAFGG